MEHVPQGPMGKVFELQYANCDNDQALTQFLEESISQDVIAFNIPSLPPSCRVPIGVFDAVGFSRQLERTSLRGLGVQDCIAFSDSRVCVLAFEFLKNEASREDYFRAIRHECIHVLQHLASKVPPHEMIWLYESVACAIAEQWRQCPDKLPSWMQFSGAFYAVPDAYAVAYHFGKALLARFSIGELVALSSRKEECLAVSQRIFSERFAEGRRAFC